MELYSIKVYVLLIVITLFVITSAYFHCIKKNYRIGLLILVFSGLLIRLLIISIDPFLQPWDERFHALVAKNVMSFPFKPMLRVDPILPYAIENWYNNHVWLHKQPLFLWQMALSMKLFGVNEIAVRMPSAIMGTISIYFIYDIAKQWIKNIDVAFLAALLFSVSYYQLELTSGRAAVDHNDVVFFFYVTGSFWAFTRYLSSENKVKWAILIGLFSGCAVLNKWLTGILIFGGWGLYELLHFNKDNFISKFKPLMLSITICLVVFVPWQLYILNYFPIESNHEYEYNRRHVFEVIEGHSGPIWFHFDAMIIMYRQYLLIFIPLGLFAVFRDKQIHLKLSIAWIAMVLVVFSFFSFIAKTKMPSFTFPVSGLIWILIASGIMFSYKLVFKKSNSVILFLGFVLLIFITLRPTKISDHRSIDSKHWIAKVKSTKFHKALDLNGELKDRIILNCGKNEDIELMFYKNVNAYYSYPDKQTLDSLINIGYKFAAFKTHNQKCFPEYIYNNKDIIIIDKNFK